jgi:hypothetical protein
VYAQDTNPTRDIVSAKEFRIVDERGVVRAQLTMDGRTVFLGLNDRRAQQRVRLAVEDEGRAMALVFQDGQRLVMGLMVGTERENLNVTQLILQDRAGKASVMVGTTGGYPQVDLLDAQLKSRVGLGVTGKQQDTAWVWLSDAEGRKRLAARSTPDRTLVSLVDRKGHPRILMGHDLESGKQLILGDRNGRASWSAP